VAQCRSPNLGGFIREDFNPVLRGWGGYCRLAEVKGHFEEIDAWLRRKPRCSQWRQRKRMRTRRKELSRLGGSPASNPMLRHAGLLKR
jgi:hypothetical protein